MPGSTWQKGRERDSCGFQVLILNHFTRTMRPPCVQNCDFVLLVLMEHPCSHKLEHCFTHAGKKLRTNPCTVEEARQMQSVFGESYLERFPTTCSNMSLFKCTSRFFVCGQSLTISNYTRILYNMWCIHTPNYLNSGFLPIQTLDPIPVLPLS